jgi:hypothetical protein
VPTWMGEDRFFKVQRHIVAVFIDEATTSPPPSEGGASKQAYATSARVLAGWNRQFGAS